MSTPAKPTRPPRPSVAPVAPTKEASALPPPPPGHVRCETCNRIVLTASAVKRSRPDRPERWGCFDCHQRAELAREGM